MRRPQIFQIVKFRGDLEILKFGTKIALFGCFGQQFPKTTVIFALSNLSKCKFSRKTKKIEICIGLKVPHLGIFRQGFEGNYCHI